MFNVCIDGHFSRVGKVSYFKNRTMFFIDTGKCITELSDNDRTNNQTKG